MNKPWSKHISHLIILLIVYQFISLWWPHRQLLFDPFDFDYASGVYTHSQYNLGHTEFFGNIDDDLLHQYSGYQYIQGVDPSVINPEVPPLGKYLYGLSILVTSNAYWAQFIFSLSLLVATWYLARQLIKPTWLAATVPLLLSCDKLFIDQSLHTLLDLPQALAVICCLIGFQHFLSHHQIKYLIWTGLCLGFVASIKLWITAAIIGLILVPFLPRPKLSHSLLLFIPALLVFFISYLVFFLHHPNPIDFIHLQITIARLYRSYLPNYPWAQIVRITLFGRWLTWWGLGTIKVTEWSLLWPLSFISVFVALLTGYRRHYQQIMVLSTIILGYIFSNLFHVVFPRYLLLILPLTYICLLYSLAEVISYVHRHRR